MKDIILWILFIGIPLCFNAVVTNNELYYKDILKKNLTYLIFIEFIVNTHTFSLGVELMLVPFSTGLVLLQIIASFNKDLRIVENFLTILQIIFGIIILCIAVKNAIQNYSSFYNIEILITFSVPLVMTIIFLPLAYAYGLYSSYEQLFIRIKVGFRKDKKIRRKIRWKILFTCKLSLKKIHELRKFLLSKIYTRMSEEELKKLFQDFKKI